MKTVTLVLNLDYRPVSVCHAHRAFLLVFQQKADLIIENSRQSLHTVQQTFPLPAVIRLKRYIRLPYKDVLLNRENIFRRDRHQCQYCGTAHDLTLDHVIPRAKGGASTWHNLVTACKRCNSRKGDFAPEEVGLKLINKPFKPSYVHFLRDFSGDAHSEWLPFLQVEPRVA
jgi:5-methylcytosine-specific restriction endonuclease McrA